MEMKYKKIEEFQDRLSDFIRATEDIAGAKVTHLYVDDPTELTPPGSNPFRLVLEGVRINHGQN